MSILEKSKNISEIQSIITCYKLNKKHIWTADSSRIYKISYSTNSIEFMSFKSTRKTLFEKFNRFNKEVFAEQLISKSSYVSHYLIIECLNKINNTSFTLSDFSDEQVLKQASK